MIKNPADLTVMAVKNLGFPEELGLEIANEASDQLSLSAPGRDGHLPCR